MFAYCGNNPIVRTDSAGFFWGAIAIGFVAGVVSQYVCDVVDNVKKGKTGLDIFSPTSSTSDYLASGIGGAIAAVPGLNLLGTMAVGAAGNIVSQGLKGNIKDMDDLGEVALQGAIANGIGYGAAKSAAALKVKQIEHMPRSSRKIYLRDNIYHNSQANANQNLHTFANSSTSMNIKTIETEIAIYRSGFYSTIVSSIYSLWRG